MEIINSQLKLANGSSLERQRRSELYCERESKRCSLNQIIDLANQQACKHKDQLKTSADDYSSEFALKLIHQDN